MNHRPRVWGRITGWNAEMERSNERQRQAAAPPADYQAELDMLEEQLQNPISAQFRQRQRFERERRSPAPRPLQRGNVEEEFVDLNQMSLRPLNAQSTSADVHQPTSVQTDVSRMLESELFSDVTFVVGNQRERVPAHQFVLSVRSKVFAAMFHNPGFQQSSVNGIQEVEVPDIEPSIFRVMLRFIYTDQLKLSPDEVMAIVYAARKYEIQSMESACITYLKKNLDAENVFFILEQSRLFDLNELSAVAWDFIDNQPHAVLNGESFVDIGYSTLCELLRRDSFGTKERDIYDADVYATICKEQIFKAEERIAIGVSGGKDSTVLAHVLTIVNQRHSLGLELVLVCVDEGIAGYRDHSIKEVRKNETDLGVPLKIVSYAELYGYTMDKIHDRIGAKNNCTYCGVFRRHALDNGSETMKADKVATGHNADDIAETVLLNILRGDVPRLQRCTSAITGAEGSLPRVKPFKYSFEKDIVMYAHFQQLNYFSTECKYAPDAFRGHARTLIKDIERDRPAAILDLIRGGELIRVRDDVPQQMMTTCERCGYISSQRFCKACLLLTGLETGDTTIGISKKLTATALENVQNCKSGGCIV
ncbi:Cytoplasmic tRNA 2-thiolation protein 1 [Aphelenchoides besseyi]|nr:Cytoplasmic tRNA 2-thiolation protein 1 [Aphelenchoides besseyi]